MTFITALFYYIYALIIALLPITAYSEGMVGQPNSFLPSQAVTSNDKTISRLIYRGLFTYDIFGTLIPDLAETWEISEDGLVYTVKIKDNQYWSNGKKITSEDLIYTSFKVPELNGVATDKVDELTVRYILPNKYSPFLSLLTMGIMPVNAEEKMSHLRPISSGDFSVGIIEKNGSLIKKIVLASTKSQYDIKKLVFRYYTNEDELVTASKLGEIDGFVSRESHELASFTNYKFPLQGIYYALFFNLRNDKYKDLVFRQDLAKALKVSNVIVGKGITVEGPISRNIYTDRGLDMDAFEVGFSKDLSGKELTLTIADVPGQTEFAKRIKDVWEDTLDINVTIRKVDPEKIAADVINTRDFEVLLYGQEVGRDPDRYVNWHSSQKDYPGINISGFDHIRADRALEEGRNEITNEGRVIHYKEFQKVVTEQIPAIFLYHPFMNYYISQYVDGVGEKYTFTPYDRFLDFANWKRIKTN